MLRNLYSVSILSVMAGVLLCSAATAQTQAVNLTFLEGQNPVSQDAITSHGPDLFGDRVNLFNGALEFEHTDLSLPGNSQLPVALVRRYGAGKALSIRGQFGDWDLEAPRIGGTFSMQYGWVTNSQGGNRCSGFSMPPGLAYFIETDYWRGTHLHVPGHGGQEVLRRSATYGTAPADGVGYPLVTHRNWQISCLASIQNGPGEGFVAVAPDGTRYRFDWLAARLQTSVKKGGKVAGRQDVFLMATQVTDRFGNWVRYTYDSASPSLLSRIEASDGRTITVANVGGRAMSATDGTRTVSFSYSAQANLSTVQQSDGSRWTLSLATLTAEDFEVQGEGASCEHPGTFTSGNQVGSLTHPSGAVGTFTTTFQLFGRTNVLRACNYVPNSTTLTTGAVWPRLMSSQALLSKQISGPGMSPQIWSYSYGISTGWSTCVTAACITGERSTLVADPLGNQTRHSFGNRWRETEGQLLRVEEGWNGSTALRTTANRYRLPAGQPYPEQFGTSLEQFNADWLASRHRPQDQRTVSQQGVTFTWQVGSFDTLVRPVNVTKSSTLGHTRSESTAYYDHFGLWVLGQVASVSDGAGLMPQSSTYDPGTAKPSASYEFGRLSASYTWYANGLLNIHRDAAAKATTFSSFMRGVPQRVDYADGSFKTAVVNNLGLVTSRTNQVGTTTLFGYDTMGRLASITHPNDPGLVYHPTTQVFEQVNASEYGIAAGHWRQTVSTGNARTIRYFDALWRERLKRTFDAANEAGTASVVETRWDPMGRKQFTSYPARSMVSVDGGPAGASTVFDALGRPTAQYQDSELGLLTTSTTYLGNFQKQVTNARGHATTYAYQAFDAPTEDAIVSAWGPEGSTLTIVRDGYGKPLSISRSGSYGGNNLAATRSYVYDNYQRLCKTIEPETAANVLAYDSANNIAWRSSGLALLATNNCDQTSVPETRKINYSYDARNRLLSTTYGDGSYAIVRSYTADGLPSQVSSAGAVWTYGYNNRRLLTAETMVFSSLVSAFNYGIDAYGHVASLNYPDGASVSHSPDALGRPTQVSGHASGVWHHPNGLIGGYTLANGIAHSTTQTLRGLPQVWRDSGVVQDAYDYDANGNVASITDQQEGLSSRAMGYDGLDRLTSASGIWGAGSYGYDPLDNLRTSMVGSRSAVATIDAANRLSALTVNGAVQGFGYDANGNLTQRGSQGFNFDIGNRLQSAAGKAAYYYDGHGRRVWVGYADGSWKLQVYSSAGKLLFTRHSVLGTTRHVYLGSRLIAEVNSVTGASYLHADVLGSPTARTNASGQLLSRTRYEPYGATAAGTNPTGIGFTGHVNDADTGLVYMQQRYYDPIAGRFLSVDPVVTDQKTGSSFNRYVYGNNNPYRFKDPDGRFALPLIPLIIEAVATAVASNAGAAVVGIAGGVAIGAAINATSTQGDSKGAQATPPAAGTPSGSGKGATPTAPETRAGNVAKGVPESQLGPSGKPKIHVVDHGGDRKGAKDAARAEVGSGGTATNHTSPAVGKDHYHGETQSGEKSRTHHEYK